MDSYQDFKENLEELVTEWVKKFPSSELKSF